MHLQPKCPVLMQFPFPYLYNFIYQYVRKITASQIFNGQKWLTEQAILLENDGTIVDIIPTNDAGLDIEEYNGILSPGFINAHCHVELSHMKNEIPPHTGLVGFIEQILKRRDFLSQEEQSKYHTEALQLMWDNGIVAVGDICNGTSSIIPKLQSPLMFHHFLEVSGWVPAGAPLRMEKIKELQTSFAEHFNHKHISITPHAPYSVSSRLWKELKNTFADQIISIHNQETVPENELFQYGTGAFIDFYNRLNLINSEFKPSGITSFQSVAPYLQHAKQVILVHNTEISETDLLLIQQLNREISVNFFACICIAANLYIENKVPPIPLLQEAGIPICLGTDSLASNTELNVLHEIQLIHEQFPSISWEQTLQWATWNGAQALGMADQFGKLEKGRKPGICLIDPNSYSVQKLA